MHTWPLLGSYCWEATGGYGTPVEILNFDGGNAYLTNAGKPDGIPREVTGGHWRLVTLRVGMHTWPVLGSPCWEATGKPLLGDHCCGITGGITGNFEGGIAFGNSYIYR